MCGLGSTFSGSGGGALSLDGATTRRIPTWVQGSGFMVQVSGFRVQGAGCRVQGSGFRVQGARFRVQGVGFGV